MGKAEEKSLKEYPQNIVTDYNGSHDLNYYKRVLYQQGYLQTEKDKELTWEDIADILDVTDAIANDDSMEERLKTMSEEEYCQEVLKRFKEEREILLSSKAKYLTPSPAPEKKKRNNNSIFSTL